MKVLLVGVRWSEGTTCGCESGVKVLLVGVRVE